MIMESSNDMIEPMRRGSFDSISKEAIGGHSVADLPKNYYLSLSFIASFIAFALAYQSGFLGFVLVANVLPIINADIGPSPNIVWVILAYILCQCVTYTVVGRLSDVFGRRWYYIGGNALAVLGGIICARSVSVNMLIAGSALSGFGSGVQMSSTVVSGELVPNEYRYTALGIQFGFLAPLSTIAPGLARVFVDRTSQGWRWCYYFIIMVSATSGLLQLFFYHPPVFSQLHRRQSRVEALKGLDYGGLVLFSSGIVSLLLGISWGGQAHPWASYQVIVSIVAGAVVLIAFIFYERFSGVRHPLMPLHLFKNRNYVALIVCSSVGSMIFYAVNIVWPQEITLLFNASPQRTGWLSSTTTAGAIGGEFFAGFAIKFIGKMKWQLVVCAVIFTALIGGLAAVDSTKLGMAVTLSLISSLFIGYSEVITLAGAPLMVEPKHIGLATGVGYAVRTAMSSLSSSIYTTILANKLATNIPLYITPVAMASGLSNTSIISLIEAVASQNITAVQNVPGITPRIIEVVTAASKHAYQKSFSVIYLVSIAFGCCAIISALVLSSSAVEEAMTTDIARRLQHVKNDSRVVDEKDSSSADVHTEIAVEQPAHMEIV